MKITIQEICLVVLLIITNGAELIIFSILDMELPSLFGNKGWRNETNGTIAASNTSVLGIELIYISKYIPPLVLSTPLGYFADRYWKSMYITGYIIHSLSAAVLVFQNGVITYILANTLSGLAMVFTGASLPVIFQEIFPGKVAHSRIMDTALMTRLTGVSLSLFLGPWIWEMIGHIYGAYVLSFSYLFITFLLVLLTGTFCCPQKKIEIKTKKDDEKEKLTPDKPDETKETTESPVSCQVFLYFHLSLSLVCNMLISNTSTWRLQTELDFTSVDNGEILSIALEFVSILCVLLVLFVTTNTRRIPVIFLLKIVEAIGVGVYPYVTTYKLLVLIESLIKLGQICYFNLMIPTAITFYQNSEATSMQRPLAVFLIVQYASQIIGGLAANVLYEMLDFNLFYSVVSGVLGFLALTSLGFCAKK